VRSEKEVSIEEDVDEIEIESFCILRYNVEVEARRVE